MAELGDGLGGCEEAIHRLYHFLDGELTEDRREVVRRHLEECEPCLRAFGFEAEVRHMLATRCRETVPDHLRARIAALIGHEAEAYGGHDPAAQDAGAYRQASRPASGREGLAGW